MIKEFKEFISKGNVIDMAVGVVMGTAFMAIVTAIVTGIFDPLIGVILSGINVEQMKYTVGNVDFAYGLVINALISFLVVGIVMFFIIKAANKLKKEEIPTEDTKQCQFCKSTVDVDATRCPFCTSVLEDED